MRAELRAELRGVPRAAGVRLEDHLLAVGARERDVGVAAVAVHVVHPVAQVAVDLDRALRHLRRPHRVVVAVAVAVVRARGALALGDAVRARAVAAAVGARVRLGARVVVDRRRRVVVRRARLHAADPRRLELVEVELVLLKLLGARALLRELDVAVARLRAAAAVDEEAAVLRRRARRRALLHRRHLVRRVAVRAEPAVGRLALGALLDDLEGVRVVGAARVASEARRANCECARRVIAVRSRFRRASRREIPTELARTFARSCCSPASRHQLFLHQKLRRRWADRRAARSSTCPGRPTACHEDRPPRASRLPAARATTTRPRPPTTT